MRCHTRVKPTPTRYVTVDESHERRLWYLIADHEGSTKSTEAATTTTDGSSSRPQGEGQQHKADEDEDEEQDEAPVLLWLTGGPGCSSLDAFIYEHGPFLFSYGEGTEPKGKRKVVLRPNPYSYTKVGQRPYGCIVCTWWGTGSGLTASQGVCVTVQLGAG